MECYKNLLEMVPKFSMGINLIQFMLSTVSCIFAVLGTLLVLMAYGFNWASLRYMPFLYFRFDATGVLMTVAVVMFIMSVLGGTATISRSNVLLGIYTISLFLLIIIQLFTIIFVFIILGAIYSTIESNMVSILNNQTEESWKYTSLKWDYMQSTLYCCGVHGPKDWEPFHVHGARIETDDGFNYTVPYSCCSKYFENFTQCYVPAEGCFSSLSSYISTSFVYFGCIILVGGICEVVAFSLICPYFQHTDRLKSEEELKRKGTRQLKDTAHSEEVKPLLTSSSNT